jgi:hypothetical protein
MKKREDYGLNPKFIALAEFIKSTQPNLDQTQLIEKTIDVWMKLKDRPDFEDYFKMDNENKK